MNASNIVILRNVNITRDAETKKVGDSTVASFGIAKNNGYFDKGTNAWKETAAYFFNCEIWNPSPTVFATLVKGKRVNIVGELKYDAWDDKNGQKQSRVSIRAHGVDSIERREAAQEYQHVNTPQPPIYAAPPAPPAEYEPHTYQDAPGGDIPF